jgi:chromosomal replication initiation ATPase DnaA
MIKKAKPTDPAIHEIANRLHERGLLADADRIAAEHHVTRDEILGVTRVAHVVRARDALIAHLRDKGFSYPGLGNILGRDHTTLIAAYQRHMKRAA